MADIDRGVSAADDVRWVLAMAFTGSHFEEALNMLESLRLTGALDRHPALGAIELHVYSALNDAQHKRLQAYPAVKTHSLDIPGVSVASTHADYGTTTFTRITTCKFPVLIDLIEKHPRAHVVWLDTDLFFFKDPRPALLHYIRTFTTSCAFFQLSRMHRACTGFFMLPAGHRVMQRMLLARAQERLTAHIASGSTAYSDDEECMKAELKTKRYAVSYFTRVQFPNGEDFFVRRIRSHLTILVHNNFIRGLEAKIARFKEHNLWLI
jgi:hypothetical protein